MNSVKEIRNSEMHSISTYDTYDRPTVYILQHSKAILLDMR